ncbi:hypothetical protein LBMAG41_14430 [Cyanobium sp.]|nr:hypothetical protein LBMAG41_14430 [Cyanobium sp.]
MGRQWRDAGVGVVLILLSGIGLGECGSTHVGGCKADARQMQGRCKAPFGSGRSVLFCVP